MTRPVLTQHLPVKFFQCKPLSNHWNANLSINSYRVLQCMAGVHFSPEGPVLSFALTHNCHMRGMLGLGAAAPAITIEIEEDIDMDRTRRTILAAGAAAAASAAV